MTKWEEKCVGYVVRIVFGEDTPMFVSSIQRGGTHHCVQFCPDLYNAHMYSSERTANKCLFDTIAYLTHMDTKVKFINGYVTRYTFIRHYESKAPDGFKGSIHVMEETNL